MRTTIAIFAVLAAFGWATAVEAAVQTMAYEYSAGGETFEGHLAWDDALTGPRPAVMIVHQWKGLTEYEQKRAAMIAELGYVAFAIDAYGKGIRPQSNEEAMAQVGRLRADSALFRSRIALGLATLKSLADGHAGPAVDASRIAAIGYCFGGQAVLELARSGAELGGVVSFHGSFETQQPAAPGTVKAEVLVLHGAQDKNISAGQLTAFEDEMRAAQASWEVNLYSDAVHAFTQWHAGNDPSKGAAYDETADKRSWERMRLFFVELFAD
jgi:dienelactone hydrolase